MFSNYSPEYRKYQVDQITVIFYVGSHVVIRPPQTKFEVEERANMIELNEP
jgi:hypothetical protein